VAESGGAPVVVLCYQLFSVSRTVFLILCLFNHILTFRSASLVLRLNDVPKTGMNEEEGLVPGTLLLHLPLLSHKDCQVLWAAVRAASSAGSAGCGRLQSVREGFGKKPALQRFL